MQALLFKIDTKWRELVYACFGGKNDIFELIEDSHAENTKRQIRYAVSRLYLKNYDILSCLMNCSVKSNYSLF